MTERNELQKPKWWKKGIEGGPNGCICCPSTVNKIPMNTRMYNGFGGWTILKDGKTFYMGEYGKEFEDYPTLIKFEKLARQEPNSEWMAHLYLPLREAKYQRHGENTWVLIEKGDGFA